MATFDLKGLARRGAEARIAELRAELEAIYRVFPELRAGGRPERARRGRRPQASAADVIAKEPPVADTPRRGGRRTMTAAEREAARARMKQYWAERRAAQSAKKR